MSNFLWPTCRVNRESWFQHFDPKLGTATFSVSWRLSICLFGHNTDGTSTYVINMINTETGKVENFQVDAYNFETAFREFLYGGCFDLFMNRRIEKVADRLQVNREWASIEAITDRLKVLARECPHGHYVSNYFRRLAHLPPIPDIFTEWKDSSEVQFWYEHGAVTTGWKAVFTYVLEDDKVKNPMVAFVNKRDQVFCEYNLDHTDIPEDATPLDYRVRFEQDVTEGWIVPCQEGVWMRKIERFYHMSEDTREWDELQELSLTDETRLRISQSMEMAI